MVGPARDDAMSGRCLDTGAQPAVSQSLLVVDAAAEPLRVELNPGWGTLLCAVAPNTGVRGTPLPNVRVLLDGLPAGVTDEHGQILLTAGRRPQRIELRVDGYRVWYGSIDPVSGAPESQEQHPYFVVMQRDD